MSTIPKAQISFFIDGKVYTNLSRMAAAAGDKPSPYARTLFLAAYTARCGKTGDDALDEAVALLSQPMTVSPVDTASAELIANLQAKVAQLEALIVEDQSYKGQLVVARNEIDRLRGQIDDLKFELSAKPQPAPLPPPPPSIPNTALGRFLHAWNAETRIAQ